VTSYTTSIELAAGATYSFVVESRNSVGYSLQSIPISIIAAQKPDVPAAPVTKINGATIIVSWVAPSNGAAAITAYTITIR
jgi:hypothetical protein